MALQPMPQSPGYSVPGMVDVGAGARAWQQTTGIAIGVAGDVAEIAGRRAAQQAELSGKIAGAKDAIQYDANGNLLPLSSLPDQNSIYGRSYAQAAITNYASAVDTDAQLKAIELSQKYRMNPMGFKEAWNAWSTATVNAVHPQVAPEIMPNLARIGGSAFANLADAEYKRTITLAAAQTKVKITDFTNSVPDQYKNMGLTDQAIERMQENIKHYVGPLADAYAATSGDPGAALELQKNYIQQSAIYLLSNDAMAAAAVGRVNPETGKREPDMVSAEAVIRNAFKVNPKLQTYFSPTETDAAIANIKQRVAGQILQLDASMKAATTAQQVNYAATGAQADLDLSSAVKNSSRGAIVGGTFDANALPAFVAKIQNQTFDLNPVTNATIKGRYLDQASQAMINEAQDVTLQTALGNAKRIMGGEQMILGPDEAGELTRQIIRQGFAAAGMDPSPKTTNPDVQRQLYETTGGFTAVDRMTYETASSQMPVAQLTALAVNFRAIVNDRPDAVNAIAKDKAELLLSFADNVIDTHNQRPEGWAALWDAEHNAGVQGRNAFDNARATGAIAAMKDQPARAADVLDLLNKSRDATGFGATMWRTWTKAGEPVIANLTPFTYRNGSFQAALTSGLPHSFDEFFGGLNPGGNAPVVLPLRLVDKYYTPAYGQGYLDGGPLTAKAAGEASLGTSHKDIALSGFGMPGGGEDYQKGSLYLTDYSPEARYRQPYDVIAERLGEDLQTQEKLHGSLMHSGDQVVNWVQQGHLGNLKLLPRENARGEFVGYQPYLYQPETGKLAPIFTPAGTFWDFQPGQAEWKAKQSAEDALHAQHVAGEFAGAFFTPGSKGYGVAQDLALPITGAEAAMRRKGREIGTAVGSEVTGTVATLKRWLGISPTYDITTPTDEPPIGGAVQRDRGQMQPLDPTVITRTAD